MNEGDREEAERLFQEHGIEPKPKRSEDAQRQIEEALAKKQRQFEALENGPPRTLLEMSCEQILRAVGEDPTRGGLVETPTRFAKAWWDYTAGYRSEVSDVLKTFEDGAEGYDELLVQPNIPFYSHCEHHLAPFFGVVHVAYIANSRIAGLSKFKRVVDVYARRLQVQERLTVEIADALMAGLKSKGVAVVIDARHLCMESRGVECRGVSTRTSKLHGVFLDKPEARAELMQALPPVGNV